MIEPKDIADQAKIASEQLRSLSSDVRNQALSKISESLLAFKQKIKEANKQDIEAAEGLSSALKDRLLLTEDRIEAMAKSLIEISKQDDVVGQTISSHTRDDGLIVKKVRIPIGVILMIFESRPNVVADCSALAIKSGNAIILKGGKEAFNSNKILGEIITDATGSLLPDHSVQVVASDDKTLVQNLLSYKDQIDLVVPRGGTGLVNYIYSNSQIPVIAHFQGLCHIYIDKDANLEKAKNIVLNAKTQRPGVCNAMETLLVHENHKGEFLEDLIRSFKEHETKIIADNQLYSSYQELGLELANDSTWATEHLDNILSLKLVDSVEKAIEHINTYGSNHTEAIITENQKTADQFASAIDASCIMHNASTRFNDGGELGLGAELGISTTKIHAYGPMGAAEMTTSRFLVIGDGHVRQ